MLKERYRIEQEKKACYCNVHLQFWYKYKKYYKYKISLQV